MKKIPILLMAIMSTLLLSCTSRNLEDKYISLLNQKDAEIKACKDMIARERDKSWYEEAKDLLRFVFDFKRTFYPTAPH
jgi:hypothetical protein